MRGNGNEDMIENNVVKEKSVKFAIRIVEMYKYISNTKQEQVMSKQLLRSGTSNELDRKI